MTSLLGGNLEELSDKTQEKSQVGSSGYVPPLSSAAWGPGFNRSVKIFATEFSEASQGLAASDSNDLSTDASPGVTGAARPRLRRTQSPSPASSVAATHA